MTLDETHLDLVGDVVLRCDGRDVDLLELRVLALESILVQFSLCDIERIRPE